VEGGYDQADARGFIKINSLRLKAHKLILGATGHEHDSEPSPAGRPGDAEGEGAG
jgi:hypothetical protein